MNNKIEPLDGSTMPAAYITKYGKNQLKYGKLPTPIPAQLQPGELLVKIQAVALHPADYKIRNGSLKTMRGKPSPKTPAILGYDYSGTIIAIHPQCKESWKVGQDVMGIGYNGALCSHTIVNETMCCEKPSNVPHAHAAALVTGGLTSLQAFRLAKAYLGKDMEKVLITAGAGGVGHIAIQMAKQIFKVPVVAATASSAKAGFVKECGADLVADLRVKDAKLDPKFGGFDMVIDSTNEKKIKTLMKPGGVVIGIVGIPSGDMITNVSKAYHMDPPPGCIVGLLNFIASRSKKGPIVTENIIALPNRADFTEIAAMMANGTIKVTIDKVFPLSKAADAFTAVGEGHVVGRVIVECDESDPLRSQVKPLH